MSKLSNSAAAHCALFQFSYEKRLYFPNLHGFLI